MLINSFVEIFPPLWAIWSILLRNYSWLDAVRRRPPSLQTGVNGKPLKIPLTGNGCWSMRNYFISSPNMSFILPTFSEKIDAEMTSIAFSVWSVPKEFEICRPCEIYHTEQQLKRSTCFEFLCHCVWHLSFLESYIHR